MLQVILEEIKHFSLRRGLVNEISYERSQKLKELEVKYFRVASLRLLLLRNCSVKKN